MTRSRGTGTGVHVRVRGDVELDGQSTIFVGSEDSTVLLSVLDPVDIMVAVPDEQAFILAGQILDMANSNVSARAQRGPGPRAVSGERPNAERLRELAQAVDVPSLPPIPLSLIEPLRDLMAHAYMLGFRAGEMSEDEGLRIADLVVRAVRHVFAEGLNVGVNAQ